MNASVYIGDSTCVSASDRALAIERTTDRPANGVSRRRGVLFLVVLILYFAAIFAVSHVPGRYLDFGFRFWDKLAHFVLYAPAGFLALGWLRYRHWRVGALSRLLLATGAVLVYGISDELHQLIVPGRQASVGDLIADALGGLVGALIATAVLGRGGERGGEAPLSR